MFTVTYASTKLAPERRSGRDRVDPAILIVYIYIDLFERPETKTPGHIPVPFFRLQRLARGVFDG